MREPFQKQSVLLADAQAVGRTLRAAGWQPSRSSGTRIRGAPRVSAGYKAERYIPLGTRTYVVRVIYIGAQWSPSRVEVDEAAELKKMAAALEAAGFQVTFHSSSELYVLQEV